ncbi:hypothetical protein HU200_040725 [Digitaria exilis]|uniref:Glycosyltransferase n=1 Tax=Digitaria exilis TaxID=1010633 RepID=A0A835B8E3_9POAL|nr:hypothetical protein HU200_040725 [Digitaria exilis]
MQLCHSYDHNNNRAGAFAAVCAEPSPVATRSMGTCGPVIPPAIARTPCQRTNKPKPCPWRSRPTIVLLPIWGTGHLMPMLEAGKRLLARGGDLSLTRGHRPRAPRGAAIAAGQADTIHFHNLPIIEHPPNLLKWTTSSPSSLQLHVPHVRDAIAGLKSPVAAMIIDFFCTPVLDVSGELGIPTYVLLRRERVHSNKGKEDTVDRAWLTASAPDEASKSYKWFVYHSRRYMEATGIIINTAAELESNVLAAIADRAPPIYPIGPVLRHECVRCLTRSTGVHGGSFTAAQVREIAEGLERTHRRGWMHPTDANLEELLPDGFLERTKGKGMVVANHGAAEGDTSSCAVGGFRDALRVESVLESLCSVLPMVTWPLYAEQHFNAFTLVADLGVAVGMKMDREMGQLGGVLGVRARCEVSHGFQRGGEEGEREGNGDEEDGGSSYTAVQRLYARAAGGQNVETPSTVEDI